jgi:preprotein translocase subunit YajC
MIPSYIRRQRASGVLGSWIFAGFLCRSPALDTRCRLLPRKDPDQSRESTVNFECISQGLLLAEEPPGGINGLIPFMWLIPVIILYVFLIQRPQRNQQKQQDLMLKNIKKNDRVITTSGIYGVVTNVQSDADEVTIKVDESNNTKLRMTLSAVARVVASDGSDEKDSK